MTSLTRDLQRFAAVGLKDLLTWAVARRLSFGSERSVRLSPGLLETERCLFSFSVNEIGESARHDIVSICQHMHAPDHLVQQISRFFSAAAFVHFGFESTRQKLIGKCYLELPDPGTNISIAPNRLQFLGFKWSVHSPSLAVVSRYRLLAVDSLETVAQHMQQASGNLLSQSIDTLFQILRDLSAASPEQNHAQNIRLLDIEEEGSARKSLDLNIYDFGVQLAQFRPAISAICSELRPPLEPFDAWFRFNQETPIGHLATGRGRNDEPFLTIYYGLQHLAPPTS